MKILALAMLLAIMQAAPPVPRKAADSPTSASKKVQNDTSHEQNNASQFEATNANTPKATDHQNATNGQRHEDADRPIAIRELPTVTVNSRRDWADWGTWIFSFLLMVVGALQVLLLRWTLRVIRRQAKEMIRQRILMRKQWGEMSAQTASLKEYVEETKKIAKSTADNVQIIINKERARIRVEVSGDPKLFPHDAVGHINELAYTIFCDGSTPAFITKSWANLKVTDSKNPSSPFPNIPMSLPAVMHPSVTGLEKTAMIWQHFEQDLEPQLLSEKLFLHFYGVIEYTDAFEISRCTKFRYFWGISNSAFYGGPHGYWIKNGEEENKCT